MKLFNIGMVLDWAEGQNKLRNCNSVFIKNAKDEYAALLKINEAQNTSDNNDSTPIVAACCSPECEWFGLDIECVTMKHDNKLLCPECKEVVETRQTAHVS